MEIYCPVNTRSIIDRNDCHKNYFTKKKENEKLKKKKCKSCDAKVEKLIFI